MNNKDILWKAGHGTHKNATPAKLFIHHCASRPNEPQMPPQQFGTQSSALELSLKPSSTQEHPNVLTTLMSCWHDCMAKHDWLMNKLMSPHWWFWSRKTKRWYTKQKWDSQDRFSKISKMKGIVVNFRKSCAMCQQQRNWNDQQVRIPGGKHFTQAGLAHEHTPHPKKKSPHLSISEAKERRDASEERASLPGHAALVLCVQNLK